MSTTWLTAVFDVDANDQIFHSVGTGISETRHSAQTSPDQGIARSRPRLRPADAVIILVANHAIGLAVEVAIGTILGGIVRVTARQACAVQRVEVTLRIRRVDRIDDVTWVAFAFVMADMLPLATDARIV